MARDLQSTPQLRIAFALHKARQFRHHRDCHCGRFDGVACSAADAMWTRAMDRELEDINPRT